MAVRLRPTVYGYMARLYAGSIITLLFGLVVLLSLFDTIENLRILGKANQIKGDVVLYLTALKVPGNILMIAPFVILFAGMWTLATLSKRQEFVILRVSGASLWQLLTPLFWVAFLYGAILVTAINPLSAITTREYDAFRERAFNRDLHQISLMQQGLWLRQAGPDDHYFILHAERAQMPEWTLNQVMVLYFTADHSLEKRLDAPVATLVDGAWDFPAAIETSPQGIQALTHYREPTTLTSNDLQNRFLTPDTISIWNMPRYIQMFKTTGFSSTPLQVQFGRLLMLPILCAALVMIAAIVALRPARAGDQGSLIMTGILAGFLVFFISNFLHALGASGQIPVWLAATAPAFLTTAIGSMTLLSVEDQ